MSLFKVIAKWQGLRRNFLAACSHPYTLNIYKHCTILACVRLKIHYNYDRTSEGSSINRSVVLNLFVSVACVKVTSTAVTIILAQSLATGTVAVKVVDGGSETM